MTTRPPDEETQDVSGDPGRPAADGAAGETAGAETEAEAESSTGETDEAADAEPGDAGRAARSRPSTASLLAALALALAVFSAAATGFLWWQYRQFYVALDQADGETVVSLRELRADLRTLEDRIGELNAQSADSAQVIEQIVDRVDALPGRFSDLEARVAAAQGISADARGRWLRAQAEYFLGLANAELTLRGDRGNAVAALELADQRLLESGSPAYSGVRERIAGELLALRSMSVPDIEGLSYSLSRLAARVGELPMRAPVPERGGGPDASAPDEPGLARLWQSFKNALAGMIRIERRDTVDVYTLTRGDQALVRRQLELELTLGRLGLVQTMPELFTASLESATALLEQHFDTEQASIEGALTLLGDMLELDIAPSYPDISGSLTQLRNLPDRDG